MPTAEALSESTWPEGHTVTIDGVEYGAKDIVPGSDKTFDDPWWNIVGPGGMTNWQVFGPLGAGGYMDESLNPDWFESPTRETEKGESETEKTKLSGHGRGSGESWMEGQWFRDFSATFPGYARLLEADPSLMGVVGTWWQDHADDDYNDQYNSLLGAIQGSDWFMNNAEPMRDSLILEFTDPAQWEANLGTNEFDFKSIAKQEGYYDYLNTRTDYWGKMSKLAERGNWSEAQIRTRIVQDGLSKPSAPARGQVKRNMDRIQGYANDMLVNMSSEDARKFATYMEATGGFYVDTTAAGPTMPGVQYFQGAMSWEGVQDHIQGLAKAKWDFVDIDDLAERGMTIADTLSDVRSTIANTLELNSENVNLMGIGPDNLIHGAEGEGAEDGRRFMDVQEAEHWAKKQSRYQITDEFRGDIRDLAGSISQAFGQR